MSATSRKRRKNIETAVTYEKLSNEELQQHMLKLSHEMTKRVISLAPELAGTPIEFSIRNGSYTGPEALTLAEDAYYKGAERRGELDAAAVHLGDLLENILHIVAYNLDNKPKTLGLLLDLAKKAAQAEAGSHKERFAALSGEIVKRFSMLRSAWERYMPGRELANRNNRIIEDIKAISEALEKFTDDNGELLRQNLDRRGMIAEWSRPSHWKKATGMSENLALLAEKADALNRVLKDYHKVAEAILGELKAMPTYPDFPEDSPEKFAWDTLIISDGEGRYKERRKRSKYLSDLVLDWKAGK